MQYSRQPSAQFTFILVSAALGAHDIRPVHAASKNQVLFDISTFVLLHILTLSALQVVQCVEQFTAGTLSNAQLFCAALFTMAAIPARFPHFPRLPLEIQTIIWKEALKTPRIVQLCCDSTKYSTTGEICHRRIPALLQTCSQSRRLAQQIFVDRHFDNRAFAFVYLQPKVDIVYYGSANIGQNFQGTDEIWSYPECKTLDATDVGTVAIEANYWLELDVDGVQVYDMRFYTGLSRFIIVLEERADPARHAEFIDLTNEEHRDISAFLVNSKLKTSTELIGHVRKAFQQQFEEWELPASEVQEVVIKKLRGNILGQKLYGDTTWDDDTSSCGTTESEP